MTIHRPRDTLARCQLLNSPLQSANRRLVRILATLEFPTNTALGFGAGAIWWFGYHKPTVAAKDAWYAAREQEKNNQ